MPSRFPDPEGKIYEIYGDDPARMAGELLAASGADAVLTADARIALKPNLVVGRPAEGGATTHPEILAGIIEYLQARGCRNIEIIEGSWVGDDTGRAYAACGMNDLGKKYGVKLYDLKKDATVPVDTPAGKIQVCRRALESDVLINLPVLKGHCQTRMTCAIKNLKGCISDGEKRRFHREGLDELIAALSTALHPTLTIVDGICGDLDFEEGGNPVQADRMLLGTDVVKLDAHVCALMGMRVTDIEYLTLAEEYGVGTTDIAPGDVVRLNEPRPGAEVRASGKVRKLAGYVKADQACSACYANVIHALKRLEERRGLGKLPPVYIGQGWQGGEVDGVGIGKCCKGTLGSAAGCPPSAMAILETLEAAMKR